MFGGFLEILLVTGAGLDKLPREVLKKLPILNKLFSLNIKICITYIQRFKQIAMLCYSNTSYHIET